MDYGIVSPEKVASLKATTTGKTCTNRCGGRGFFIQDGAFYECPCIKDFRWKLYLTGANIPFSFWDWSLDRIDEAWKNDNDEVMGGISHYIHTLDSVAVGGEGLFLQSPPGIGKTVLGCIVLMEALKKGYSCYYNTLSGLRSIIMGAVEYEDKRDLLTWIKNVPTFIFLDEVDKINKAADFDSYGSLYLSDFITDFLSRSGCLIVASNWPIEGNSTKSKANLASFYPHNIIDRFKSLNGMILAGSSFRVPE
jgi:hypothetical protein